MDTPVIEVRLWGQRVGAVAPDPRLGCYVFAYEPAWTKSGIEVAPLTMPLDDTRQSFAFPELAEPSYKRLPGLLADALPDDFGNALIDAWMSARGVDKSAITPLDRLAYMGKRGMGALEFKPSRGAHRESAEPLEMKHLVEAARRIVQGELSGDVQAQAALANIIRVGTSAGGARAKAVVAWNPQSEEIRSGQFDAAPGFEHWLLKFDGVGQDAELGAGADYGRIEYAYHLMAQAAGIHMSPCRLLLEGGRAHFMTRRFDRDGADGQTLKHHVQTLCALRHLDYRQRATHAYAQLFMTVARLGLGDEAVGQVFRRMAFNVMARNCDDHSKNFAFLLRQGGDWELAPAYDVTHAYNPRGEWTYQHLMSVNGRFAGITRADLLAEADRFGVRRPRDALTDIRAALDQWSGFARQAGLGERASAAIQADFEPL
ncbi:MAG: type II toxin-antitoxin system HipA family toxin [Azonexus sp.]|nr:type II toxin-antitoxin system HipA family toxin [Betaproteobacteria bacterium]MBK8919296.1 type II toxin-antitoxin system HipA family toxin [Betaproteobacteria bacterium]MBP6035226.1 type II toxin-antitoxin system HipA family toxin [Azonexus sp.]MBP6905809.1 type II toxin-antitoxin system HipA family toxin [Azonexus sp.]